ncbi:unnamed protein product [Dovyalis caffra]|uniref:TF-B3 domain-containing protein n=1 Tax=Dovyalis caffra TaxID=77055 RepID=A0AAV1SHY6_9ROSI|nr:unnamed protein product [Dovyalis caffra]
MEVMIKLLSESDTSNNRLEFPTESLRAFPLSAGQNSVEFDAFDKLDHPWRLKISVRNQGKYPKPWISGQWGTYVLRKGLKQGDRVTLTLHEQENGFLKILATSTARLDFPEWSFLKQLQARKPRSFSSEKNLLLLLGVTA